MDGEKNSPADEKTAAQQSAIPPALVEPEPPKPIVANIEPSIVKAEAKQATVHADPSASDEETASKALKDRIRTSTSSS